MATKTDIRIRALCRAQGITQAQLADRLGIRRESLSQAISRNNFDLSNLRRIASALNVELWQLFKEEDKESEAKSPALTCPHCGKPLSIKVE